ncbi:hypothetical protein Ppa06_46410 [Planomonospora parontospora subsp. parontospora]|uniref:Uncharacterized protein n=2 Tax=Planomonospora parontospora TaxID=58119 RepID=A0AA37F6S3_9ACTN|nr:hypothetical protein [Planomonospora parontospora]GGK86440.1 hypothetical protein GCM10010126_52120 [Planomonospora parontospora]GII10843.1 hypothetical protein Ppa06_46410 [Planomonospora parontospora subsp. parontospora]
MTIKTWGPGGLTALLLAEREVRPGTVANARVGAALGLTGVLPAAAAWTGSSGDVADGLRAGFAIAAGLAVLGAVCTLVMFTRPDADPATAPPQPQGAHRR